jgi:hypothetical protein
MRRSRRTWLTALLLKDNVCLMAAGGEEEEAQEEGEENFWSEKNF